MAIFLFDVFGTVVNWRPTVTHALSTTGEHALSNPAKKATLSPATQAKLASMTPADWEAVACDWRASYKQFTRSHSSTSDDGFVTVDQHHYNALPDILAQHGIAEILPDDESTRWDLVYVWHRLPAWPDSAAGLARLNQHNDHHHHKTSTLSNGNIRLLQDLAQSAALPFQEILSAEHFGAYKPAGRVYQGAAHRLGVPVGQCVMVAAHLPDLQAAKQNGFRTVFVEREGEDSLAEAEAEAEGEVDWVDEVVSDLTSISVSV